ncbi:MAG: Nramp family divalent metal transporter [Chloroflexota bacterium]|nr:Nramp family divalent metal transporter [Chloroflexota bacterium]
MPATFLEYVKSWGPGIVVVLTWLGAGDLVDTSVAGANYGYALMWALALSLIIRFGVVSLIAKFQLLNREGVTVLAGYQRIHRWAPMVVAVAVVVMFHFYNSYMVKGAGNALARIFGVGDALIWAIIAVAAAWFLTYRALYGPVEKAMMAILALLVVSLVGSAIMVGPDFGGIASGVFGFAVPPQTGPFGAMLIVVSLIGAVAGSVANFMYPYLMQEKGWTRPKHRKVQLYDLLFGIIVLIIIDLAIWILGAEVLRPRGIVVENVDDMAGILAELFGTIGGIIFYLGVFGATFSSILGYALGGPMILKDAIRLTWPDRAKRYPDQNRDPWVQVAYYFIFVAALVWAIPGMPGFVFLTVVVSALTVPLLPLISIGLLIILNRTDLMGDKKNNILENTFLVLLTALAIWGGWQAIGSLADTFGRLDINV